MDGALLYLCLSATKTPVKGWRLTASAVLGGVFAVAYPLFSLPRALSFFLKIAVGFLLPIVAFPPIKRKKEWGMYGLSTFFFFLFTASFGGILLGVMGNFSRTHLPFRFVAIGFVLLSAISLFFIKKLYCRRRIYARIRPCAVLFKEKRIEVSGFLDSGNLAMKKGLPVCFLSSDIFFDLFGEDILLGGGQVREEMTISTMSGEKRVPLYRGFLEILGEENCLYEVYFAPSANMISREYKVILHTTMEGRI